MFTSWYLCVELDRNIIVVKPHWHVMCENSSTFAMHVIVIIWCQSEPINGRFRNIPRPRDKKHTTRNPEACVIHECAVVNGRACMFGGMQSTLHDET